MSADSPTIDEVKRTMLAVLQDQGDPVNENQLYNLTMMRFRNGPSMGMMYDAIQQLEDADKIRWVAFRGFMLGGRSHA
jgi:hypothetical protein